MSVRQRYTRSFALKFTETETTESASCLLSLFYKSAMFCCYCECTQINVKSLQIRNVLLLSVRPKMREYFKSKWSLRRLHLSCSELLFSSTRHRHLNSTQISRLTLDWAPCKVANTYIFQMIVLWSYHQSYLRSMIGECLDVLPDVLPHRPTVNDLRQCGFLFVIFFKHWVQKLQKNMYNVSWLTWFIK